MHVYGIEVEGNLPSFVSFLEQPICLYYKYSWENSCMCHTAQELCIFIYGKRAGPSKPDGPLPRMQLMSVWLCCSADTDRAERLSLEKQHFGSASWEQSAASARLFLCWKMTIKSQKDANVPAQRLLGRLRDVWFVTWMQCVTAECVVQWGK